MLQNQHYHQNCIHGMEMYPTTQWHCQIGTYIVQRGELVKRSKCIELETFSLQTETTGPAPNISTFNSISGRKIIIWMTTTSILFMNGTKIESHSRFQPDFYLIARFGIDIILGLSFCVKTFWRHCIN